MTEEKTKIKMIKKEVLLGIVAILIIGIASATSYDEFTTPPLSNTLWANQTNGAGTITYTGNYVRLSDVTGEPAWATITTRNLTGNIVEINMTGNTGTSGTMSIVSGIVTNGTGDVALSNSNKNITIYFEGVGLRNASVYLDGTWQKNYSNVNNPQIKLTGRTGAGGYLDIDYVRYGYVALNGSVFLTFSEPTNYTIQTLGEGVEAGLNKLEYFKYFEEMETGEVLVSFGDSQKFSFYNDGVSAIDEYLQVIDTDLVQKVKISESGAGLEGVLVKFWLPVNGVNQIIGSGFTDSSGEVFITLNDGDAYKITLEKSGYNTTTYIREIPAGNTNTLLLNMEGTTSDTGTNYFTSNCGNKISKEKSCWFKATTGTYSSINITYNISGVNYQSYCSNAKTCITNSFTINSTLNDSVGRLYVNGDLIEPFLYINYEDLDSRTIQIKFPVDTIKSDINYRLLFYFMTLILGIFMSVSIEKKIQGWGILTFIIWNGIIAIAGMWEYWLLVVPLSILQISKLYYNWIK